MRDSSGPRMPGSQAGSRIFQERDGQAQCVLAPSPPGPPACSQAAQLPGLQPHPHRPIGQQCGCPALENLSQVLMAQSHLGRRAGRVWPAAYLLQALDAGLQAGHAGPQLTVLLVQLLQPGSQEQGWDPQSCPPATTRTQHKGPGPKLLVSQDGVSTHLRFTEKLQTQSEFHGP